MLCLRRVPFPRVEKEPKDAFFTSGLPSVGAGEGAVTRKMLRRPWFVPDSVHQPAAMTCAHPRQLRPRRCIIRPCSSGRKPFGRHVCRPYRVRPGGLFLIIFRRKIPSLSIVHCQLSIARQIPITLSASIRKRIKVPGFLQESRDFMQNLNLRYPSCARRSGRRRHLPWCR